MHCLIIQSISVQQMCQAVTLLEAGGAAISTAQSLTIGSSKPNREFRHIKNNCDSGAWSLTQDCVMQPGAIERFNPMSAIVRFIFGKTPFLVMESLV